MTRRRDPPLVYVEWLDHADTNDQPWQEVADLDAEPPVCRTVGWIVKRTKTAYVIAHTLADPHVSGTFILLRSCIRRMVPLTLPEATETAPAPRRSR